VLFNHTAFKGNNLVGYTYIARIPSRLTGNRNSAYSRNSPLGGIRIDWVKVYLYIIAYKFTAI